MPFRLRLVPILAVLGVLASACSGDSSGSGDSSTGEPAPTPCDEETPCPGDETCVVGQCYAGDLPMLEITTPVDEALVEWTNDGDTTDVLVRIEGTGFELVAADMDPTSKRGTGQIAVLVDGVEAEVIDTGSLAEGIEVTVPVATDAGGHRVRAVARLSDGRDYDTDGAIANRFFWFGDGRVRVGFKVPWNGDRFTDDAVEIQVVIATLNFQLAPAEATAQPGAIGHAHLLLNKSFPECNEDPICLDEYITEVVPTNEVVTSVDTPVMLPSTSAESVELTAHLVQTNHDPFCDEGPDVCDAVWETITVLRADPAGGEDTGTGTGTGTTTGTTGETADCGGFVMTAEDSTG